MTARDEVVDVLRLLSLVSSRFAEAGLRRDHLVLWLIGRFPGITRERIGHALGLKVRSVAGLEAHLRSRGLIGRRGTLELTPAGRATSQMTSGAIEALGHEALGRLPASKLGHTREVLTALSLALAGRPS